MMKRITGIILTLFILLSSMLITVYAQPEQADLLLSAESTFVPYEKAKIPSERQKPRLVDAAGLIDDTSEASLLASLDELSEKYSLDVAVVTTPSTNGKEPMAYADDYYDYNGFGCGEDRDGAVLLISMEPRYVYISTCGKGIKILNDTNWNAIIDEFYDELKAGDYESVVRIYTQEVEGYAQSFRMRPAVNIIPALIVGFIIASIIVSAMKAKNKSVTLRTGAAEYIVADSMLLRENNDNFLYRNVTRHAIPKESSSGSGGGTHVSSSGTTHGGGGRSF